MLAQEKIPDLISRIIMESKKIDFYELYLLLETFSILEMLELYDKKFGKNSHFHILKSLAYFDDAENDEEPILIKKADWSTVKNTITEAVKSLV